MKYGKLIDGVLYTAPNSFVINNRVYYNPSAEMYLEQGFLEIVETPYPISEVDFLEQTEQQPSKTYDFYYEKNIETNQIVKVWFEKIETESLVVQPTIEDRVILLENKVSTAMEAIDYLIMEE